MPKERKKTRQEMLETLVEATALYESILQKKAKKSTFLMAKEVLGYPDMGSVHKEWEEWYEKSEKKLKLFLVPRGHLKSTFWTISYVLRRIVENPNIRILIANATYPNAKNFVNAIKTHIESNETFRRLYGSMDRNEKGIKISDNWSSTSFTVPRTKTMPEATVYGAGVGGNVVSQHYDLIIWDDLVNDKNVTTREQIDQIITWWKNSLSLLEEGGEGIMVGTRWDFKDLYSYILESQKEDFDVFIRSCYKKDGSPYFPEKFSKEHLDRLKRQQGSYIFSCLYLNDPSDAGDSPFPRSLRKYWTEIPDNLAVYITCDPSTGIAHDFSGIIVNGVSSLNNWYILEEHKKKLKPDELVDFLWDLRMKYRKQFKRMAIERDLYKDIIERALKERMKTANDFFSVEEVSATRTKSKEGRIMGLQPRYEAETIFLNPKAHDLEYELDRFPKMSSESYDLLDALSMQLPIARAAEVKNEEKVPRNSFMGFKTRMDKARKTPMVLGGQSESFIDRFLKL